MLEEFDGVLEGLGLPSILDDACIHERHDNAREGKTY